MTDENLTDTVAALLARVDRLEAAQAVRTLHHTYGYYLDKCLYEDVVDLFADDADAVFLGGLYRGKGGVRRLFVERFQRRFTDGLNGPRFGFLLDHPQHQDVITVSEDGRSARGRFRCTMQAGLHDAAKESYPGRLSMDQWWEGGLYENEYVKEDGVWKIARLNYRPVWHGEYGEGWAHKEPMDQFRGGLFPEDPLGPDAHLDGYGLFPDTSVFPFHYAHPVTGRQVVSADPEAARHA
ncbi:nuclear transport factor 2 family protein [Microbacterium sp. 18062]|uniref:nuclear transport factor 2 family protein n=1 Tax=Microbacterium sp. 18062 TaxID=2681410 RepID=UPI00135789A4|nr:nuclear transport factor 2 family protein [Microbacterium sp. 18062]